MYIRQPLITFSQAAPVQNTWYPFTTVTNGRIHEVVVSVALANETLEFRATVDGVVIQPLAEVCTFGSHYRAFRYQNSNGELIGMQVVSAALYYNSMQNFLYEGRSVLIEVRKTTAAGAGTITGSLSSSRLETM